MREHPWILRRMTAGHERRYANLGELHGLTLAWLEAFGMERPEYEPTRGASGKEVVTNLWMLEALTGAGKGLEGILDDTLPDDVLGRLEHTVWAVQAQALKTLLDKECGMEALEKASWKHGRAMAARRWNGVAPEATRDLQGLLLAAFDCPQARELGQEAFLVRRATRGEIRLELRECPHRSPYPETSAVAGELCSLHAAWMKGFLHGLNDNARLHQTSCKGERCQQLWFLAGNAPSLGLLAP